VLVAHAALSDRVGTEGVTQNEHSAAADRISWFGLTRSFLGHAITSKERRIVARAVLSDGASGYVLKLDANRELLREVEVVLQGGQFVSAGVRHSDGIPPLA